MVGIGQIKVICQQAVRVLVVKDVLAAPARLPAGQLVKVEEPEYHPTHRPTYLPTLPDLLSAYLSMPTVGEGGRVRGPPLPHRGRRRQRDR